MSEYFNHLKSYCVSICAFYGNIIQTLPYILLLELTMTITIKCADNDCNFVGIFSNVLYTMFIGIESIPLLSI